jgi:hypothetical protein
MSNANEPFDPFHGRPYYLRQFADSCGWLGFGVTFAGLLMRDVELAAGGLVVSGLGQAACAARELNFEDHERFRSGDSWRARAIWSFALPPWVILGLFWNGVTSLAGLLALGLATSLLTAACMLLGRSAWLRTPRARRSLLRAATLLWALIAVASAATGLARAADRLRQGLSPDVLTALLTFSAALLCAYRFQQASTAS